MIVSIILVVLCGATKSDAQAKYLGAISGTVADTAGGRIPGASVVATDTVTKFVSKVVTDGTGEYTIPFLTPDTYEVTVSAKGFGPQTKTEVVVTAGGTADVPFTLVVGSATTTATVTADSIQLDTESGQVATTISTQQIVDTPLIGHNPFIFTTLGAGVYSGQYMQSKASSQANQFSGTAVQLVINGISGHVRLTLDGMPDDPAERFSGTNYLGFVPSMEAVQEVKVQNTLFDAEVGHGAGVENTVLRAGTNQYHGAAYYVFQNTYMDANTSERVPTQNLAKGATPRTNDQTSQPGFVIDGPASIPHLYNAHDKTYFMVAYERVQAKLPITSVATVNGIVPTAAQRKGDFSALCTAFTNGVCNPGAGQQLYDPTQATAANGNRVPFLNNQIPSSYFTGAVGAALMALFPQPNATPTTSSPSNYIPTSGFTYDEKYFSIVGRVDQSFSNTNKMNASFFKAILNQLVPNDNFPTPIGQSGMDYTVYRNNVGGHLQDLWMPSATLAIDTHIGLIYHPFGLVYQGLKYNLGSLGINANGLAYQSFPGIAISDPLGTGNNPFLGLAAGAGGQVSTFTLISPGAVVSKTHGKHSLRFGFDSNFDRYDVQNPQSGFGTFTFNRQFTQQNSTSGTCPNGEICSVNGDSNSGYGLASMLLGYPSATSGGYYANNIAYAMQQVYYGGFVQDDMRVSQKLTLNMGFRWDYESPFTERYNRMVSSFCTTCVNPMQAQVTGLPLLGGLQYVTYGNRTPYPKSYSNWQPRFGGAYQLMRNLVLRGGFGIVFLNTLESPISTGYSASTSYVATTDNIHPANNLSNPFPSGVVQPTGSSLGLATALGQGVTFTDPSHVQPKDVEWSVSTEYQAPWNVLLSVAYVGQKESREEVNKSINGLPIQYYNNLAQSTYLNTKVANPMYGAALLPTSSSIATATILQSSLLVPYPEFTGVTDNYASVGEQLYNSLQISAAKRMSHGLSLQGNVTWDKLMDQNSYLNAGQNTFN
ncbi:MAG: TonB-dependent receptor, partial [Terracidiphilus sp.]